ncbi:MAG: hypothetical protein ACP5H3_00110 [Candidatus Aenigmatarchaeota archaeon]
MKSIAFLVISILAFSVVAVMAEKMEEKILPTAIPEITGSTEKTVEKGMEWFGKIPCSKDEDCSQIVCPMVIGMDTPMCKEGKCICGPGIKAITLNETKISACLEIRKKLKEIIEDVREIKNETEREEKIDEFLKLREEFKDCFPQPVPTPIPIIAKKYAIEKMENLEEFRQKMEELHEEMLNEITTQNLTGRQLAEVIHEYNKKRKELVKEFVEKIHEINMERMEEIKEIVVGKHAEWEGEKLANVTKITVTVNGKTIEIHPGDNVTISVEGVVVKSLIPLKIKNNTLEDAETNETIRETPEEVRERIRERIREMKLERKAGIPVYSVAAVKSGRLLGIIPLNISVNYEIAATNGTTISVAKPWWSFLVFG